MRVELSEIECVLIRHPDIEQAAVILRGQDETRLLIAFYTACDEDPGEDVIISYLSSALPKHMVPARCIGLKHYP